MTPLGDFIMHRGALGDWILSLPLLEALGMRSENAPTTMAVKRAFIPLLEGVEAKFVGLDSEDYRLSALWREGGAELGGLGPFKRVCVFGRQADSLLLENLSAWSEEPPLFVSTFPEEGRRIHVLDHQQEIMERVGLEPVVRRPRILPPRHRLDEAGRLLASLGVNGRPIAVHMGSGGVRKNWPPECFEAMIRTIENQGLGDVVLIEGPAERSNHPIPEGVRRLSNLPLHLLAAVLTESCCYIGNDSGVTHLAAAVGTRTFAVFGPTDPRVWAPRGSHVTVLGGSDSGGFPLKEQVVREVGASVSPRSM